MAYPACERCGKPLGPGDAYTATGTLPRRCWHRVCFDAEPYPLAVGDIYRLNVIDGQYLKIPSVALLIGICIAILSAPMPGRAAEGEASPESQAMRAHIDCNAARAKELAKDPASSSEPAPALGAKALEACRSEWEAVAKFLSPDDLALLRAVTAEQNEILIGLERRAKASPTRPWPTHGPLPGCASCGMDPTWDERLKIWRPYRQ